MNNVVTSVVDNGLCIGCGMCAGICPKGRLEMRFNERGEYNPVELKDSVPCPEKCNLCYQVCPAHGDTKNETDIGRELYCNVDGMQYRSETGYYLSSYLGYSNNNGHRENGASGGMATWTLETLLVTGEVDAVACVGRTYDSDRWFEFRICTTTDDIRKCSRSAYYPVETSRVIQHIMENEGRYAIIGLPCVCKAVRLAQDKIPKLKDRIKYVLGITCGHTCSKYFAEYLVARGGGSPYHIKDFIFRMKKSDESAKATWGRCFFRSVDGRSEIEGHLHFGFEYGGGYFQLKGCFYCDDRFAECADIAFMDAWLPEYEVQPEGHSIVLLRNPSLMTMISGQIGKALNLSEIDVRTTISSQKNADMKRRKMHLHYRDAVKRGVPTPKIRKSFMRPIHNPIHCAIARTVYCLANSTGDLWKRVNKDIELFDSEIKQYTRRLKQYRYAAMIFSPSVFRGVVRKIKKSSVRRGQEGRRI